MFKPRARGSETFKRHIHYRAVRFVVKAPRSFSRLAIDPREFRVVPRQKHDAAVRRSQDVLDLEPNNVTALQIMGSAFYMMEQKDKALAVWRRAIELDPENREIREFIKRMKAQ